MALPVYLIHWNAPEWVRSATESILASDTSVSVTVINNSPDTALALDPRVRITEAGGNLGYAGGANIGIREWLAEGGEWCVVASHDLLVQADALRLLLEAGERNPSFGVLGPATTTNWAGELVEDLGIIEERTMMSGTCLLLRRACLEEIGGFDEAFGSYGEDDELCHRARAAGWRIGRVMAARAEGIGSRSTDKRALQYGNHVLLKLKTEGWVAATRLYLVHLRRVLKLSAVAWRPGIEGVRRRHELRERAMGLRRATIALIKHVAASRRRRKAS